MFTLYLVNITDEVEHSWFISSHSESFSVLCSAFSIFQSTLRSPTCEQRGVITVLNFVTLGIYIFRVCR